MSRIDHLRLYGLPETSDRMQAMLRDNAGSYSERRRHIRNKMAAIRKRRLELGMEGAEAWAHVSEPRVYSMEGHG